MLVEVYPRRNTTVTVRPRRVVTDRSAPMFFSCYFNSLDEFYNSANTRLLENILYTIRAGGRILSSDTQRDRHARCGFLFGELFT